MNILGIQWTTKNDLLHLAPTNTTNIKKLVTKREILQQSCKTFDPLGFATPVTIRAKILIQTLWKKGVAWDEPLDTVLCQEWSTIFRDIVSISDLMIPRQYFNCESKMCKAELHLFCDASIKAYGTIAFFFQEAETTFVMSRGRVAPLKTLTLPQLELLGALTAARLGAYLQNSLSQYQFRTHIWTDSQIVLYWLQGNKKLKQFVQYRVAEIQQLTQTLSATWHYCPTADNPADMITRGTSTQQLASSSLWNKGPPWLTNSKNWPQWSPSTTFHLHVAAITSGEFVPAAPRHSPTQTITLHKIIDPNKYSSLGKLLRITAYVHRFTNNLLNRNTRQYEQLTPTEIDLARVQWINMKSMQLNYPTFSLNHPADSASC